MKKVISSILVTTFLILNFTTAGAFAGTVTEDKPMSSSTVSNSKPKITLDDAKKIAVQKFAVPKDYKLEHANYEEFPGRKVWNFRWVTNVNFKHTAIHVAIDADNGELRSYYYEHPSIWEPNYEIASELSRKEAREIAISFIKKHHPQSMQYLQEAELPVYKEHYVGKRPMKRYHFRFVRLVNDIPFDEEGAFIDVLENGKIASYNFNWSKLPTDLPQLKLSQEKANQIFYSDLGLKLTYVKDYGKRIQPDKVPNDNKLVYQVPEYANFYIDAVTGEVKDFSGIVVTPDYLKAMNTMPKEKDTGKFYIDKSDVAKEDAMKAAEEVVDIPEEYKLNSTEYRPDYFSGRPVWVLRYAAKDTNIEVNVAADNAEIISFYKFRPYPPGPIDKDAKLLSNDELRKIAEDFIAKIAPTKAGFVQIDPQLDVEKVNPKMLEMRERWFHFTRYVNGIPVAGEGMGISIDPISGEILNFNQQFSSGEFKLPSNVLPSEKMHEKFFKKPGLRLSYFRIYTPGIYGSINEQTQVALGYRMQPEFPRQFDAVTGEPVYEEWQKPIAEINYPKDIDNHRYHKAIKKLVDLNIMGGQTKDSFYPDKAITKAEFVKTLVVAKGYAPIYDASKLPYEDVSSKAWFTPYLKTALAQGIIVKSTKFNPDSKLSREDASKMIVRALGYEKIAKLNIFKEPKDIKVTTKDLGFAAIVEGLKIFPEKQEIVTRGESAQVILNIMAQN